MPWSIAFRSSKKAWVVHTSEPRGCRFLARGTFQLGAGGGYAGPVSRFGYAILGSLGVVAALERQPGLCRRQSRDCRMPLGRTDPYGGSAGPAPGVVPGNQDGSRRPSRWVRVGPPRPATNQQVPIGQHSVPLRLDHHINASRTRRKDSENSASRSLTTVTRALRFRPWSRHNSLTPAHCAVPCPQICCRFYRACRHHDAAASRRAVCTVCYWRHQA